MITWGLQIIYASEVDMPPAEENIREVELIPEPYLTYVPDEHHLMASEVQLFNFPISQSPLPVVKAPNGTPYAPVFDYVIHWETGTLIRAIGSSIPLNDDIWVDYYYKNQRPSTMIIAAGRKRQQVTMECSATTADYNKIRADYQDKVVRALTLPGNYSLNAYIYKIGRATIPVGLNQVYYSITFIEA